MSFFFRPGRASPPTHSPPGRPRATEKRSACGQRVTTRLVRLAPSMSLLPRSLYPWRVREQGREKAKEALVPALSSGWLLFGSGSLSLVGPPKYHRETQVVIELRVALVWRHPCTTETPVPDRVSRIASRVRLAGRSFSAHSAAVPSFWTWPRRRRHHGKFAERAPRVAHPLPSSASPARSVAEGCRQCRGELRDRLGPSSGTRRSRWPAPGASRRSSSSLQTLAL